MSLSEPLSKVTSSKNRAIAAAVAFGAIALIEGVALVGLLPLKEKVPYFITVDPNSGKVIEDSSVMSIKDYKPADVQKAFFIRRWVENALTLDSARSKKYLFPEAYRFLKGGSREQFKTWLAEDKSLERLIENPLLARHVRNLNINFVKDSDSAVVRFVLETTGQRGESLMQKKSGAIRYSINPADATEDNPLGFYILDFNMKDEI